MPSSSVCWGIEIGAGAIKAVKLEVDDKRVTLLDYALIDHPKVLSSPDVDANDVLRVSLGALVSQYDLSRASIAVSVPGDASFARFAKLPPVEPKKVPDIVKFEAMQQIPFPLEQVEWDYQTFVSPDSPDVEVGIFAITKERIASRLQLLTDVGITPDFVTLSPIAVFNALAYDLEFTEQSPGTIIVDVGTRSTDLVVAEAGRVWVRTFPIGGHQFTESLVNAFKITYAKAEKLKREAEESSSARQVFQAMRPVFTDLGQDIQRSIGYYQSLHKDAKLTRLIGVGSTFLLPGLRKYLKQQLALDVYRIEQFKRMNVDGIKDEARSKLFADHSIKFGTAYGLAIQGLGMNTISCNLMPVETIRESMWKGKVKWFGLAAGVAAAAGSAMFIRPTLDYFAKTSRTPGAQINQAVNEASRLKQDATAAGVIGGATADLRAANMVALLDKRDIYAHLVKDLGEMLTDANKKEPIPSVQPPAGSKSTVPPQPIPTFTVKSYKTEYSGSAGGAADPNAAPAPAADGTATPGGPHITCELEVTTIQPDTTAAQRVVINTLTKWLKEHTKRPSVPYVLRVDDRPWQQSEVVSLSPDKPGETTPSPGVEPPPARGGRGAPGPGDDPRLRTERRRSAQPDEPAPQVVIVGGGRTTGGTDSGNSGAGAGDVNSLAPTEALKPPMPRTGQAVTFKITWRADLAPPDAEADPAAADKADKKDATAPRTTKGSS